MTQNSQAEEWKVFTLPGILKEEIYEVSIHGNVRHFNTKRKEWVSLKTINQFKDGSGFEYVTNFKREKGSTKRVTESVHRIVARNFLPNPKTEEKFVIHLDYNKMNNHASNLKWLTRSELNEHNNNNPKVKTARSNRIGNITHAKLNETDVIRLKKRLAKGGEPLYKVARDFGITHTQLNRIRKGENWGHVTI